MTKDLTHDFDVGSRIDRSTRVTVPKRMGPEHFRCNTRQTSVVLNGVTHGRAGN